MNVRKPSFPLLLPCVATLVLLMLASLPLNAQTGLTWDQVKDKFEAANPTLKADALNVQEMKAEEITAYLRPNPQFTMSTDGTQIAPHMGVWQPFKGTQFSPNFSYLHERDHKRELRLQSAQEGTQIAGSQHSDLERNMLFNLRSAFNCRRDRFSLFASKAHSHDGFACSHGVLKSGFV